MVAVRPGDHTAGLVYPTADGLQKFVKYRRDRSKCGGFDLYGIKVISCSSWISWPFVIPVF